MPGDDRPSDHRNVALTTYRRSGDPVTCPVWIVDCGDGTYGITTEDPSGKVKRLRHDDRVELRPCDSRGKVPDGAPAWTGTAALVSGEASDRLRDRLRSRYGIQMRLIEGMAALRRKQRTHVGIIVTLDEG